MGAINYLTNEYITLAFNTDDLYIDCYDYLDCEDMDNYECGILSKEVIDNDTYYLLKCILNKYNFSSLNVKIEPGYYEGFQLLFDTYYFLPTIEEIKDDMVNLKKLMYELVECGMVATYPGWAMKYETTENTMKLIDNAIKQMTNDAIKELEDYEF